MRVLFFSNNPSDYYNDTLGTGYHGGGWVSSVLGLIKEECTVGFAFFTGSKADGRKTVGGVEYFPVFNPFDSRRGRVKKLLPGGFAREDKYLLNKYSDIVEDFRPDVIVVFGSEHSFGLVAEKTQIPVILHVQGLLGPCLKNYFPPTASWRKYILSAGGFSKALWRFYFMRRWRYSAEREKKILRTVGNYFCRTDWDKAQIREANPDAKIFHCEEVLRDVFYNCKPWSKPSGGKPVFVTTISEAPYKGMDLILRTGSILKADGFLFDWKVYGNVDPAFFEKITGIGCADAGITLCGPAPAEVIAEELSCCTAYVHPSYIDNSPNSVCEAQIIGAPAVASRTGGIPSIIEDGKTGLLFPVGDAAALAGIMEGFIKDSGTISGNAAGQKAAEIRHSKNNIKANFLAALNSLNRNI